MKSKIRLYMRIMKSIFWKSKDTKWIILMAAFVIAMVSIIASTGESIEKSYLQAIYQSAQYDFILPDLEYQEAKDYLDNTIQKYPKVTYLITTNTIDLNIPDSDFYLNAIGMEGDYEKIYRISLSEGNYPKDENEIVLDNRILNTIGKEYRIGDEIELEVFSQENNAYEKIKYRICGFFAATSNGGYELYGIMSIRGAERVSNVMYGTSSYATMVCAEEATTDAALSLVSDVPAELKENIIWNSRRAEMVFEKEESSNGLVNGFKAIGIFIAITSFTLLFNMFQMTTVHTIKQLGLLRCLGLKRQQLLTGLFLNLILYLISGAGIGFALYAVLESCFGEILLKRFLGGFDISNVDMQWSFNVKTFIESALLIFVIMLLVYGKVVWQIYHMTPLAAISYKGEGKVTVRKEKTAKAKLIPFLGKRNLLRNKWRSIYTAITVFMMTFLICTIVTVLGCIDLFNTDALKKGKQFDLEFFGDGANSFLTDEQVEQISNITEVDKLSTARWVSYELFQESDAIVRSDTRVETRVYSDDLFAEICKDNGINANELNGKSCILQYASDMETAVGTKSLILYDEQKNAIPVQIDATIIKDNYCEYGVSEGELVLVMNKATAEEMFGFRGQNRLMLATGNKEQVIEQLQAYLSENGVVLYFNDLKQNNSDAFSQLQSLICIGIYMILCIGLMAIVNIVCNISINVQMRLKEYGILMSLGMSRRQIVRLIVYEIMVVVEKAVFVALLFGIYFAYAILSMVGQEPNILKLILFAGGSAIGVYGLNYLISFLKGKLEFSKNILGIVQK